MPFEKKIIDGVMHLTPELDVDYSERMVAYVDILGFSAIVTRSERSAEDRNLLRNLELEVEQATRLDRDIGTGLPLLYSHGSDSLVVSCPFEQQIATVLLQRLQLLQHHFLSMYGILCRGGVAHGSLIHAENVFYGPAFLRAVELEKREENPRVIVSEDLQRHLEAWPRCSECLQQDPTDGIHFVDYLRSTGDGGLRLGTGGLSQARAMIISRSEEHASAPDCIRQKYVWVTNYFNRATESAPALGVPPIPI